MADSLDQFSLPVRTWFLETFDGPTPPQAQGWPPIQRGEHTLILAPTGSGKTLAAFLWGIDEIYRELAQEADQSSKGQIADSKWQMADGDQLSAISHQPSAIGHQPSAIGHSPFGIRLLYVSPLKALNNDIERNLRAPLAGIRAVASRLGEPLPPLRVAVRTGDTPSSARAAMLKQPPHILITTPESFYLMLTSPRARELFRPVRTVIVDEIHTLCGDKRGVHLSLSLERLEHLAGHPIQRIGLSATIRPLDEVARFLGGSSAARSGDRPQHEAQDAHDKSHMTEDAPVTPSPFDRLRASSCHPVTLSPCHLIPRPVTIVDTGYRKPLEIQVVTPVEDFRALPGDTVWPALIPRVLGDVMRHRSTLIFCNNRRLAERTADRLNAQIAAERSEEIPPGSTEALAPGGLPRDRGIFAIGASGPIRAHHGSMSKEARRQMEEDLKAGKLPALVGTSSLELGIDIGAVDLVVQIQSPKSVAQGLQRVGRSGHLVGQTSRGRIYATYREELDEAAALARGMLDGDVEPTTTPRNPLDVLAQQIVAMVAVEEWSVAALYDLVRQVYAYRDLSWQAFTSVLEMLAGQYAEAGGPGRAALRARLVWDRVNDRLAALPGSRLLALANPGTISDTGAYDVYLADGKTRVGQLDEEFVFETRVGDVFLLGSNTWRVADIADDRIVVAQAAGAVPRMPFWRGDYPWRPYELGVRIGRLRRELAERIGAHSGNLEVVEAWLRREYALDENSARNLVAHVSRQLDAAGVISSDKTIVVEAFQDAVGESRLVIHSPFGGRVNGAWALALSGALAERVGVGVETQVNDDGILLRYPATGREPPFDIVAGLTAAEARERILRELPDSALFGAHFRMNAARALLLPKARGRKRTPFWLQRLKAKDLLATVHRFQEFPILVETYRDCLRDALDLPHLEQILDSIEHGDIRVVPVETVVPSPVAAGLLYAFIGVYMYEWDAPKAERQLQALSLRGGLLGDLRSPVILGWGKDAVGPRPAIKPEAAAEVVARAQKTAPGYAGRTADELAVFLQELGDLTTGEAAARCAGDAATWLAELAAQGRVVQLPIPSVHGPEVRWVPVELAEEYGAALGPMLKPVSDRASDRARLGEHGGSVGRPATAPEVIFSTEVSAERILRRYLRNSGPLTRDDILARYAFDPPWLDATLMTLIASGEILQGHFVASGPPTGQSPNLPISQPPNLPISQPPLQFCDRHNLEQILRRTLASLRREVQPVPLAAYADFLTRWQGIHPERRSSGVEGLRRAMGQLRGLPLPGVIWERDVLPARVGDYEPGAPSTGSGQVLAALCEAGELVWVGSGRDPRRGRVCFFGRGEGRLFLPFATFDLSSSELSLAARSVYDYLHAEGASFLADMQAGLGLQKNELQDALAELTMAGLVTNDTLDALNAVLEHGIGATGTPEAFGSTLEAELTALRGGERRPLLPGRINRERYHAAKRRVAARLKAETEVNAWAGRWSLVHRAAVLGPPLDDETRGERLARVLLARYGVIMRETVEREAGSWDWPLVSLPLQRMELRGEVRRGYFVQGLSGVQYALPDAVEALRAAAASPADAMIVLNAADPANLYGGGPNPPAPPSLGGKGGDTSPSLPPQGREGDQGACPERSRRDERGYPAFARVPSTHLVLWQGRPVLVAEDNGERFTATTDLSDDLLRRAVDAYLRRPNASRRLLVRQWNGAAVLDSPAEALLRPLGFSRTPNGLEWWAGS